MTLEKITFGDDKIPGWVGGPKGKAAVIVIQEWWGITDEIKRQAEFISEKKGLRVLIPDLYKYPPTPPPPPPPLPFPQIKKYPQHTSLPSKPLH
jgi:dienelactone hydrolase